jgi:hypothetical protein
MGEECTPLTGAGFMHGPVGLRAGTSEPRSYEVVFLGPPHRSFRSEAPAVNPSVGPGEAAEAAMKVKQVGLDRSRLARGEFTQAEAKQRSAGDLELLHGAAEDGVSPCQ